MPFLNDGPPCAIVTVGMPASGKSTMAAKFVKEFGFIEVNLDNCRGTVSGDPSDQSCTPEALKLHARQIGDAMAARQDIIVSDTNLNPKFRQELIDKLKNAGYHVIVQLFTTDYDTCMARNNARDRKVPDHAMERMRDALQAINQHRDFPGADFVHCIDTKDKPA